MTTGPDCAKCRHAAVLHNGPGLLCRAVFRGAWGPCTCPGYASEAAPASGEGLLERQIAVMTGWAVEPDLHPAGKWLSLPVALAILRGTHPALASTATPPEPGLDVEAAWATLRRAGMGDGQARGLIPAILAAALTGERHDLDDEYLTPAQRARLARLSASPIPEAD